MEINAYLPTIPPKRPRKGEKGQIVLPGEVVTTESDALRGHGTYLEGGILYASVSGVVEKVNKLVSVKPFKSKYNGETGDVVVGRILSVGQNRWKVDINAKQDAVLLIGSINLHGGVHRRRTIEDTHEMRTYFVENDLIVADVQQTFQDGSISLQVPRTLGKLENGVFCSVPSSLVKRTTSHFVTLQCNVDIILGHNGYIWITEPSQEEEKQQEKTCTLEVRTKISRVRNSILALGKKFLPVHPDTIIEVYKQSLKYEVKDLLKPDVVDVITRTVQIQS